MARPSSTVPTWATNAGRRGTLTAGQQATGWVAGQPLDPLLVNAIEGPLADWVAWLASDLSPSGQALRATSFSVVDTPGGTVLGYLTSVTGDILLAANDGVILQAGGTGTPTIYLDHVNDTVRLQSFGADGAVLLRAGWALNDQSFRVGFGDDVGDGTGYPIYTWDRSPAFGSGWAVTGTASAVGVGLYITQDVGSAGDTAHMENQTGGIDSLKARCMLPPPVDIDEDGATARWTVTELVVVFGADTAAQPTVSLIRTTRDGANTRTTMATCQPTAAASRQTITDNTISSAELDWSTYIYFLEWLESSVADGAMSRGVEQVLVRVRTRAGL